MADETLGDLSVNITGDYSELSDAIDQAVAAAVAGADAIANAFNVPDAGSALAASISAIGDAAEAASGDVASFGQAAQSSVDGASALSDAAAPLAGSLNDAGDAANSAGGSLGGFGDNASQAAGDAQEAEGGVQSLAEQFVALGEALAVTEGLKEFGQEALTAYGTVQSVTIGLTQLTKSAEQADEIVTQIKELAATEPFAFPEIAPTIQKMVALGVSAEQIPGVMQAVADAAAATGNQFSQVANSFDRMTLSGTVSARSLVQLGVNTQQLGAAMGVAADQVKAAFLAMDQTDRINILEAAMGKFAGAAEAQAQGISGQWQIFQNTFEEVMVGVGEAIAPVVGDILDFGKTVLTEVQSAIAVFNELPSPVKDVVVVLGLVAAAVVPLTGLVSGLGFAWIGLQSAGTALTAIMTTLGIAEGEAGAGALVAAAGARTAAVAVEGLGAASAGAAGAGGVGGLATALGFLGGTVLPAAIGAIAGFGIATVKDLYLPTDNINTFNEEMGAFTQDVDTGTTELNAFGGAIPGLTANVQTLGGAVTVVSANLTNLLEPLTAVTAKQMSANSAFNNANVAVQLAKVALANAQQQYDGTAQSAASLSLAHQVLTRAVIDLDSATQAANPHAKNYGDTIAGVTQNLQLAQEKFQSLESVFATVSAAMAAGTGNVNLQAEAYTKLESAAKASGNAFADYQGILAQVQQTTAQAYASYQQLGAAYGTLLELQKSGVDVTSQLANVYQQWEAAGTKVGVAVSTIAGEMAKLTTAAQGQVTALTDTVGAFAKFAAMQNPTVVQVDATAAAFKSITSEAAAMGIQLTQTDQGFGFVAAAGTSATPALQAFIDKLNGILGATGPLVDVNGKWVQSMAALPAWLQQLVAGLQKESAAAKDATAATQAHTGSMSDNAIAAARAQQAQIDLGSTYQTVASSATNFTNAAKNQVAALENDVGAFTSLHSAGVTSLADQIALSSAFKASVTAGQSLGITITATGASSKSTSPFVQALVTQLNNQIHAMGQLTTATPPATTATTAFGTAASTAASNLAKLPQQASLTAQGITDLTTKTVSLTQQVTDANGVTQELTTTIQGAGVGATTLSQKIGTAGETITTATTDTDNLDTALQNFSSEAPGVVSAASSITTAFNSLATAADNAASAEDTLAAADAKLSAASGGSSGSNDNNFGFSLGGDNILTGGNSTPSQTASGSIPPTDVSQTINGVTTTGGWTPPPDPNPGRDHLVDNASTVGPDTNPYSWVANTTPTPAAAAASASAPAAATPLGNQPVTPVATVPAAVDNTVATQANTAATTANTGATAAATPATAADTAATQANTAATTPDTTATVANTAATQADTVAATAAAPALASVATSAANTSTSLASTATASGNVTTDLGALDTAVTQLARDEGTLDQATAQLAQDTGALDTGFQALVKDSGGFDQALQSLVTDAGNLDKAFQALVTDGGGSSGLDGVFQSLVKDGGNSSGLDGVFQALVTDGGNLDKDFQALTTDAGNLDQALQNLVTDAGNLDQALQNLVSAISNATSSAGSSTGSSAPGSTGSTGSAAPSGSAPNIPGSWQWNGVAWVNTATGDQWVFQNGAWVNLGNPNVHPLAAVPGTTPTTSTSSFPLGNQPGAPDVYGLGTTPGTSPTGPPPAESGTWTWNGSAWVQVGGATASGASTGSGGEGSTGPFTSQFENPGTDANGNPLFQQQGYAGYNGIDYSTAPGASTGTGGGLTGPVTSSNFENAVAGQQVGYAGYNGIDYSTAPSASTGTGGGLSGSSGNQTLTQAQINALADAGNSGTPTPLIDPNAIVTGLTEAQLEQDYPQIAEMNYGNPDLYGNYPITNAPSSLIPTSPAINLTVNINAGTVVGSNAAQQLVNMVMPQMVAQLRQAGVKI